MPRYRIIIHDAQLAHDREIHRTIEHYVRLHGESKRAHVERSVRAHFANGPRRVGTQHSQGDTECPEGLPNCRNCGDPDHAASCAEAGHCPHCGTAHGIAPDAHLIRDGYRLEPLE